jgi:predicted glycoside hydrolase/deacetylase ChbG (UPF0249 family)
MHFLSDKAAPMEHSPNTFGHTSETKLLIIHADDLGMCHSVNAATFHALEKQAISSASIMAPCPGFWEAAQHAAGNPHWDLGVHLTLTSEFSSYRWRSVLESKPGASLLDDSGYFYSRSSENRWNREEIRAELMAQVRASMDAGIDPTHVDNHMLSLLGNAELARIYIEVARHHGLPFLMAASWAYPFPALLRPSDIIVKRVFSARPGLPAEQWMDYYLSIVRAISPGLNQLTVHLGYDGAELRGITGSTGLWDAAWRQRDYDVITSEEFHSALMENQVLTVSWRQLTDSMNASRVSSSRSANDPSSAQHPG